MGTIIYGGSATPIHVEDRALAHLKVVITVKLRRHESFTLSWQHPAGQPPGRTTLWLHPSIPLKFVFDDPEPPELNRQWLQDLARSANSSGGIMLVPEDIEADAGQSASLPDPARSRGWQHCEDLAVGKKKGGRARSTNPAPQPPP